jgi:hypothetical protein
MNLEDLGRRAAACKHWRWRDGSKRVHPNRRWQWMRAAHRWLPVPGYECTFSFQGKVFEESYPDLSDPATIGCLLALVREATREPGFSVRMVAGYWYADGNGLAVQACETEAEALVAALEAAP